MAVRFEVWVGPPATPLDVLLCETITQDVLLELAPAPPNLPSLSRPSASPWECPSGPSFTPSTCRDWNRLLPFSIAGLGGQGGGQGTWEGQ